MRLLKFRQWSPSAKAFHYWGYSDNNDTFTIPTHGDSQQFTGLFDKQGRGIYEGDMIKFLYYRKDAILPVTWGVDGWWASGIGWYKSLYDVAHRCEIIGHVYEEAK